MRPSPDAPSLFDRPRLVSALDVVAALHHPVPSDAPTTHQGPAGKTIAEAFLDFHNDNPHVYDTLVRLARQLRQRGHEHLGIAMLYEVMRWEFMLTGPTTGDAFKLNNNHKALYARLIMEHESDLAGIFDVRQLHAPVPYPLPVDDD